MGDETVGRDEITVISRRLGSITANDTMNQNYEQIENVAARNSIINNTSVTHRRGGRSSSKVTNQKDTVKIPAINLPEKILIIIDTVTERNCTSFEFGCGAKFMPLHVIKKAIEVFIRAKRTINLNHEYALIILNAESANLICNFTNDVKKLSNALDDVVEMKIEAHNMGNYDLRDCFRIVSESISDITDASVCRTILIYARSNSVPIFSIKTEFEQLMQNPTFFFDALFVHEPPSDDNHSEQAYAALNELDIKQNSWIFEVGRNAAQLHTKMAKLLAHPLQRPKQDSADYKLFLNDTTEIQTNV